MQAFPRIGHGHDIHRIGDGGVMILAGVEVERGRSFIAHSDGDVAAHAVVDAILGALGQGDIGRHFPNTDERWRGASSGQFIAHAMQLATDVGFIVGNLDVTILAEAPKLRPHIEPMQDWLRQLVGGTVNIKAGTKEGCDAVGRGECIEATAVVLLVPTR